jgi:hypothetical protein
MRSTCSSPDRAVGSALHRIIRLWSQIAGSLWVRAEKTLAVEVNQVRRAVGHPNLRFPADLVQPANHCPAVQEGSHQNQSGARTGEQPAQLVAALAVDRTVRGDRFHEYEPIFRVDKLG